MSNIVQEELIKQKKTYFRQTRLWPIASKFDVDGWLSNFSENEKKYALQLLNKFLYFDNVLIESMFRTVFLNISKEVTRESLSYRLAVTEWTSFFDKTFIVRVTGETPSQADSGFLFNRMARNKLGIQEHKIITPEDAVKMLNNFPGVSVNIVFVDDFVGSGNQFYETWKRDYIVDSRGSSESFRSMFPSVCTTAQFYYCPLICTSEGSSKIARCCPEVKLRPSYILDSKYSALDSDSYIWEDGFGTEGPAFVESISRRLGIPDRNGGEGDWRGFHKLGLSLAFDHGWPDATLPLYSWDAGGWRPLLKK